jgi:hypothetical protein
VTQNIPISEALSGEASLPSNWARMPANDLPKPDDDPRIKALITQGWAAGNSLALPRVIVSCAQLNVPWVSQTPAQVFAASMLAIDREAQKLGTFKDLHWDDVKKQDPFFTSRFEGSTDFKGSSADQDSLANSSPKRRVVLSGRGFLGFFVDPSKSSHLFFCTAVCAEVVSNKSNSICQPALDSMTIQGTAPLAKPAVFADFIAQLSPTLISLSVVIGALLTALAIVLILVLRRPAQRGRESDDRLETADFLALSASPPPKDGYFEPRSLLRRRLNSGRPEDSSPSPR